MSEEIVDNVDNLAISDILIELGNYNTPAGLVAGVIEAGLESHNLPKEFILLDLSIILMVSIYKPALPGYNVGRTYLVNL